MSEVANAKKQDKLNSLFDHAGSNTSDLGKSWEALWQDGSFLPWDRGKPNPALIEALTEKSEEFDDARPTPPTADGRRKTALVPGCGRGYDVLLLSMFGYDATGLEVSQSALEAAWVEKSAMEKGERDPNGEGWYAVRDKEIGQGKAEYVAADFFEFGRENGGRKFDLVYDYTFLSALPPKLRPRWAESMSRLLAPQGRLICVEFPTTKALDSGGPPWALPEEVYIAHLGRPGEDLPYNEDHSVKIDQDNLLNPNGLVRIAHWKPKMTHAAGAGKDWVSIWKHA